MTDCRRRQAHRAVLGQACHARPIIVKLLDFGLAKSVESVGDTTPTGAAGIAESRLITSPVMMTQAGTILGTAA